MPTLIHQTGTREAMVFQHDHHSDTILIIAAATPGQWYVIREHGYPQVNPCPVMTADEIRTLYGFEVDGWDSPK